MPFPSLDEIDGILKYYQSPSNVVDSLSGPKDLIDKAAKATTGKSSVDILEGMQKANPLAWPGMAVSHALGPIAEAVNDEARKMAAEYGSDPMTFLIPASKALAAAMAPKMAQEGGTAGGKALASYDANGITPDFARKVVRSVASLGLAGASAGHATSGVAKAIGTPKVSKVPTTPSAVNWDSFLKAHVQHVAEKEAGFPTTPPNVEDHTY